MRISFIWLGSILLVAAEFSLGQSAPPATTASTQPSTSDLHAGSPARPQSYTNERWDEDYSYLADPALRTDFWDPIKYVPLNSAGDWYASFGGQIRDRYENFSNNTFGAGPQTRNGYDDLRLTFNADMHFGPYVRVFLQEASALEYARIGGPRGNDRNDADLEQGFADLRIPFSTNTSLTFRVGRQYLEFGAARLLGPADFSNVRKNFDGLRWNLDSPNNSLDFFLVHPVLVQPYVFDNSDDKNVLAGAYDILRLPNLIAKAHTQLELYELYLDRQNTSFANQTGTGTEDRFTSGVRLTSNPKPFDFDVEADYQYGQFSGHEIRAFGIATKDGYTFSDLPCTPRIFVGADVASGSARSSGGAVGTFNQLYPSGHGQFGNIDAIGRQNIIDVEPGLDLTLLEHRRFFDSLKLRTTYYEFWRQSVHDNVYTSSASVLRAASGSDARYIGSELDLLANWQIDRHLSAYFGYSHFFAGQFITETGAHDDIDFFYTAVSYEF